MTTHTYCRRCGWEWEYRGSQSRPTCPRCLHRVESVGAGSYGLKRRNGPVEPQQWFTVSEAAEYLRLSRRSIYQLVEEGQLISHRIAGVRHQRFSRQDLDAVMRVDDIVGRDVITASEDPVLAELWDNERDADYDNV